MSDGIQRRTGAAFGRVAPTGMGSRATRAGISRSAARRLLGSVVYAARLADGTIKIGWTENFDDRLRYLAAHTGQDVKLLAFKVGDRADEQEVHASLAAHRVAGKREYYHPAPEVLGAVNDMRGQLGLDPVA